MDEIYEINGPLQDETVAELFSFLDFTKDTGKFVEIEAPRLLRRTYGLNSREAIQVLKLYKESSHVDQ